MKKILSILLIVFLLLLTGCGSKNRGISTEEDVNSFLKQYKPEKFEILNSEEIKIKGDGCGEKARDGKKWTIKSLDSNVIFSVEDALSFNSYTCNYVFETDYLDQYLTKFIIDKEYYKVKKISMYFYNLDISEFYSIEDLAEYSSQFMEKLRKYDKFEKYHGKSFNLTIINKDQEIVTIDVLSNKDKQTIINKYNDKINNKKEQ